MNVTREELYMSERNIDISDMQCWVFRMAQNGGENHQWNVQLSLKKMTCWDLSPAVMICFI